jgi:RNA polymerase sigma-70 factor (ECF subfamily)
MEREAADWALVEQVKEGNDQAFEALMQRYKHPVLNFAYRMSGDAGEAEEVAMDAFARAYTAIKANRVRMTSSAFSTWLFQIARFAAIDRIRRRPKQALQSTDAPESNVPELSSPAPSADQEIVAHEIGEQIAEAVTALPEDQRAVLVLCEYEGLSYSEIAAILNSSEKSVESRLYRARQFLRKHLAHLMK